MTIAYWPIVGRGRAGCCFPWRDRKTGIYILLGDDPAGFGGLLANVRESDDMGKRLSQHARPETAGRSDF